MEIIWIITHVIAWGAGLISGMYITTQIGRSIDKNINTKNLKKNIENYESFVKKHYSDKK